MIIENILPYTNYASKGVRSGFVQSLPYKKLGQYNQDTFDTKQSYKTYVQSRLKDEETLYNLYSGKDTDIPQDVLNDNEIMSDLYKDSDFLNTSVSALKRVVEDKLSSQDLSAEERDGLNSLHNLFTLQEAMYANPENSFESAKDINLPSISLSKPKIADYFNKPFALQPSFGSIINYGFINKPKTRKEKAEALVNRYSTAAAATAVGSGAVSIYATAHGVPIPASVIDTPALTFITRKMCKHICKTYEMPGGTTTSLTSVVIGRLFGGNIAKGLASIIPGIGSAANVTTTYALHQATGRLLIEFCEKNYKNQTLATTDSIIRFARTLQLIGGISSDIYNPVDHIEPDEILDYMR